jgi:hypothetical protein
MLSENKDYVCKLNKSLYGLKQALRVWFSRLDNHLQQQGYKRGATYNIVYIKIENKNIIIDVVYVDDIIFGSIQNPLSKQFATKMKKYFEMSMVGELTFFLRLQVSQLEKGIFISHTKCIKEMLKKFQMEDCKTMSTHMIIGCKLRKDDELLEVYRTMYKSMIVSLLYAIKTRPYIMQAIGVVDRFQSTPK